MEEKWATNEQGSTRSSKEGSIANKEQTRSHEQCGEGTEREQWATQRNREGAVSNMKKESYGKNKGKWGGNLKEKLYKVFLIYINSWFIKYELARFQLVGKPCWNQFRLFLMVASKSPNSTGTLTLFLGLCPTLLVTLAFSLYAFILEGSMTNTRSSCQYF